MHGYFAVMDGFVRSGQLCIFIFPGTLFGGRVCLRVIARIQALIPLFSWSLVVMGSYLLFAGVFRKGTW